METTEQQRIAAGYRRFAEVEARGRSALYRELALRAAEDAEVVGFLLSLPAGKRQPNLLLAAVRHLYGTPGGWGEFRDALLGNAAAVRAVMLKRSTQTNEAGRCAVLLPVLAGLPQPVALIEVGASAGLCLLPDRYAYDYGGQVLRPESGGLEPPVLACAVNDATPVPARLPQVVWHAGLDLNPLDVANPAEAAWLETLVWPEQTERLARLRAAMAIAAAARPRLVKGDLRRDLAALTAEMPAGATRVIFHTAVVAYVAAREEREAFARAAAAACDVWISNEAPNVFPDIARRAPRQGADGQFLLAVNGEPVGWADAHGASLDWFPA